MNWEDFEARAKRVVPSQELKAKRCWIGVLNHEKRPEEPLEELDFIWMIGHHKIPIQKIYDTYEKRHEGLVFQLKSKNAVVDRSDTIKSFLANNPDLVVFHACTTEEPQNSNISDVRNPSEGAGESRISSGNQTRAAPPETSPIASHVKREPTNDSSSFPRAGNTIPVTVPTFSHNDPLQPHQAPPPLASTVPVAEVPAIEVQPTIEPPSVPGPGNCEPQNPGGSATHPRPFVPQDDKPAPFDIAVKAERRSPPVFHHMDEETQASFDPERFFNREPSPEQDSQEAAKPTDSTIRDIIAQKDPIMLEAAVTHSIKVLQSLQSSFSQYAGTSQDAVAWNEAIEKLMPQAQRKRTIVGVVGNTGAGKSSVINAMLDEERLVPTNCMRACTAVVTEMSWNASTDPYSKYRAEIEFISRGDWEKELGKLLKEFLTESGGVSREVADQDSDAGIAWAKFHSVYPKIPRDSLSDCTVEGLMAERAVLAVLGTTENINTASPNAFYQQLQRYVDSKEKVSKKEKEKDKDKQKKAFETEYWPLIKVVKIYVKAPALSTGAVIVDLPGVHDSNAARAGMYSSRHHARSLRVY